MQTTRSRLAGIILVLAVTVGLAACSAIKLGYNQLPTVAYWWLDGYLDFSDDQSPQVRGELARLHAWHRDTELPRLADMLGRIEQVVAGPVSPEQACAFVTEVQERLNVVAGQAEPLVVAMAAALTPGQLQHLQRKYDGNNEKWRTDWIDRSPAARNQKRLEQMVERAEMIYGPLDEPQRGVLRAAQEHSIFDAGRILRERQRRQQDLLRTLARVSQPGLAPAQARELLRGYLERAQRSPDADHRAWQEALIREGCRTFSLLHEHTTPAQRENAVRRLRAYQRDLRELSAQQ